MPIPYQLVSIVDRPVPYAEALEWQNQTQQGRQTGKNPDTLFLLEHPAVITLGRSSVPERDLLVPTSEILETGIEVYEADRGGEITYHAPGQLIGYPILELAEKERDLHRYLRSLEEVIIATLKFWDIEACRKDGLTGVWVNQNKIAAIGIKVSRWVTMHGFALNIDLDLSPMRRDIVPCGIRNLGVTSLAELGFDLHRRDVERVLIDRFEEIFDRINLN